jgi:hypothetical protein
MTTPFPLATVGHPRQALLSRKCVAPSLPTPVFDAKIIKSSWSANGFSYVACQLADNKMPLSAMHRCMQGEDFEFMSNTLTMILYTVH